tara:strand:- start:144 stop:1061 length:918 start_codon:yes stop_codon:yes gene_type:complete
MSQNLQKTISNEIQLEGIGLHTGLKVNLKIKPSNVNTGILFKRTDVDEDKSIIEANFENVDAPVLCTRIKNSYGISVSTIEHLMASFYGEGIDNALVELDAPEVPIMDGSAFDFVEAIRAAGTTSQEFEKKFIQVLKKVEIKDGSKFISIEPLDNDLIIDFEIIYKNPLIRTRKREFKMSNGDLTSIYNSRTFCLYEDIDKIINQGLAKGGSLENAIVVKESKILNENGLRNRHEFVEHKILDCIGDLMLSGHRIFGHIKSSQGGHMLTNNLLRKFLSDKSNWRLQNFGENQKNNPNLRQVAVNA